MSLESVFNNGFGPKVNHIRVMVYCFSLFKHKFQLYLGTMIEK